MSLVRILQRQRGNQCSWQRTEEEGKKTKDRELGITNYESGLKFS